MTHPSEPARPPPLHWLVDLATTAGIEGVDIPREPGPDELARAWGAIAEASGISDDELTERVATHFRLPLADMARADSLACKLVPVEIAVRHGVFPLVASDIEILIATSDPRNRFAEREVGELSGRAVRFGIASPDAIARAIERFYSPNRFLENVVRNLVGEVRPDGLRIVPRDRNPGSLDLEIEAPPVVRLSELMLDQMAHAGTTEVRVDARPEGGRVQVRTDGRLRHFMHLPVAAVRRVLLRLKKVGGLDVAPAQGPQRGSIRVVGPAGERELFVVVTPAGGGETLAVLDSEPDYERFAQSIQTTAELTGTSTSLGTVVVVDDDTSSRLLMRSVLEKAGFDVLEAEDGPPALRLLDERGDVALVLLDLNMPEMNGAEVLESIRGSIGTAGLPVVVLTGVEDPAVEVQLLEAGADDYLRKPVDPERLAVRVQAVLRRAGSYEPWPRDP